MSIAAKQRLLGNISNKLGDKLTVEEINNVLSVCTEEFTNFEMEEKENTQDDVDSAELIDAFLAAKKIEGCSDRTIKHYRYILERTLKKLNTSVRNITVYHLRQYLAAEQDRGIADKTLSGMRDVYMSFFGWLHNESLIPVNPCANLSPIKYDKKIRLPFTPTDIELLKEACGNTRDKAIICFLLSTGCRISEMCALNRDSIDFLKKECIVYGKGSKERTVFLDDVATMLIQRYLEERKDDNQALFVGRLKKRLTPSGTRAMLHRVADKAGVDNVHPHRFRRTLATNLIHRGMPIQEVAKILGHEDIDTTMTYVYLNNNDIHHSYNKFN